MTPDASFQRRLTEIAALTEASLDRLTADLVNVPDRLRAAMRHAALGGGKRLRPFLVVETAALFGVPEARALVTASALECVHCYSLVHDDLPAMDDDDLRRGRPTVHKAFDEATAILVGDALLTLAFEVLAGEAATPDATLRCRLVADLARAAGAGGMVGGQALDLAAEGRYAPNGTPLDLAPEEIIELQALKTGALMRFAVEAGALLGNASPPETHALSLYARAFGAAFQIADDLLDAEGQADEVGKATRKDAEAGKATLIRLYGPAAARERLRRLTEEAKAALSGFGEKADLLRAAVDFVATRRS